MLPTNNVGTFYTPPLPTDFPFPQNLSIPYSPPHIAPTHLALFVETERSAQAKQNLISAKISNVSFEGNYNHSVRLK